MTTFAVAIVLSFVAAAPQPESMVLVSREAVKPELRELVLAGNIAELDKHAALTAEFVVVKRDGAVYLIHDEVSGYNQVKALTAQTVHYARPDFPADAGLNTGFDSSLDPLKAFFKHKKASDRENALYTIAPMMTLEVVGNGKKATLNLSKLSIPLLSDWHDIEKKTPEDDGWGRSLRVILSPGTPQDVADRAVVDLEPVLKEVREKAALLTSQYIDGLNARSRSLFEGFNGGPLNLEGMTLDEIEGRHPAIAEMMRIALTNPMHGLRGENVKVVSMSFHFLVGWAKPEGSSFDWETKVLK